MDTGKIIEQRKSFVLCAIADNGAFYYLSITIFPPRPTIDPRIISKTKLLSSSKHVEDEIGLFFLEVLPASSFWF